MLFLSCLALEVGFPGATSFFLGYHVFVNVNHDSNPRGSLVLKKKNAIRTSIL